MLSITIILLAACLLFIYRHQQSTDKLANLREMEFTDEEQWIIRETVGRSGEKHQLLLPEDWGFVPFEEMDVVETDCEFIARSNDRVKQMGCIITDKNEFSDLQIYKDRFGKIADVEAVVFSETSIGRKKVRQTKFKVDMNGQYQRYVYYVFETTTRCFELFAGAVISEFLLYESTFEIILTTFVDLFDDSNEPKVWETREIVRGDIKLSINVPSDWQHLRAPISDSFVFVLDNGRETEIIGCTCEDKRDYRDLDAYKYYAEKDLKTDEDEEIQFVEILTATGRRYWVTEYESIQWGSPHHIFFYILEGKTQYIQLLSWTPIDRTEAVDERVIKIMNSFREISDEWKKET